MEAQFYVAASALPPEASPLIDPARSLPQGVRWTAQPPTALGPVLLAVSVLVVLALIAAVLGPGEEGSPIAGLVALVPMGAGVLWGAWTALRWMREASAWKAGRWRRGLFLAPSFLLLHQRGPRNLLVPRERVIGARASRKARQGSDVSVVTLLVDSVQGAAPWEFELTGLDEGAEDLAAQIETWAS